MSSVCEHFAKIAANDFLYECRDVLHVGSFHSLFLTANEIIE